MSLYAKVVKTACKIQWKIVTYGNNSPLTNSQSWTSQLRQERLLDAWVKCKQKTCWK